MNFAIMRLKSGFPYELYEKRIFYLISIVPLDFLGVSVHLFWRALEWVW